MMDQGLGKLYRLCAARESVVFFSALLGLQLENSAMTSEHVRAARMLLRWEQKELARKSPVSLPTIKRLEAQPGVLGAYPDTIDAIRKTFEDQGIEFFNGMRQASAA